MLCYVYIAQSPRSCLFALRLPRLLASRLPASCSKDWHVPLRLIDLPLLCASRPRLPTNPRQYTIPLHLPLSLPLPLPPYPFMVGHGRREGCALPGPKQTWYQLAVVHILISTHVCTVFSINFNNSPPGPLPRPRAHKRQG